MKMKELTITIYITENQEHELENLLPYWKDFTNVDNIKPFGDYDIRALLEYMMQFGILYHVDNLIEREKQAQKKYPRNLADNENKI